LEIHSSVDVLTLFLSPQDEKAGRTSTKSCDDILKFVGEHGLSVEWILDTHAHADHLTGAQYLKRALGGAVQYGIGAHIVDVQTAFKPIYDLHELKTDGSQFDRLFLDGDQFQIGSLAVRVIHTPGHTPACVSYVVNDEAVFVGDTFFAPDAGTARCDFPNGSATTLWNSLNKLLALPDATAVYLCHDYMPNGRQLVYRTSIGEERSKNIHIAGKTEAAYVKLREERDKTLAVPKLLLPSIQVNVDGGNLPKPKPGDKHAHLKVPLNVI
jgi:glyoxylase-like metal-dependent hydrolase (beta-lactamase superfamily II)